MHKLLNCRCSESWGDWGHVILRVVTGIIFAYHGYVKVFTMKVAGVAGFFGSVGIPAPDIFAFLVSYGELIGGIFLIVGFLTHWVAKVDILIMLGAIYFVHWANGFNLAKGGYEYALLLLAASIYFLGKGSGKYSVDETLGRERGMQM